MTAEELKVKIHSEIGNKWDDKFPHGVDLCRCLIGPELREYYDFDEKPPPQTLWLVLEEDPQEHRGYAIVYDELKDSFGLAMKTQQGKNICLGLYGTFLETLEQM